MFVNLSTFLFFKWFIMVWLVIGLDINECLKPMFDCVFYLNIPSIWLGNCSLRPY
jgi:hypothetical protein